jgi:lipoprotein-anchoring transpeptidase ErfK/SrfK
MRLRRLFAAFAVTASLALMSAPSVHAKTSGMFARHAAGTIVVSTKERRLYLVGTRGVARTYRIAVGKPGMQWGGVRRILAKREWPAWTPTDAMRKRMRGLPRHMAGGPRNPLGARALYLGGYYRIHGSNDPGSIGRAASSGCFRMHNADVIDLYDRVRVGAKVIVLR